MEFKKIKEIGHAIGLTSLFCESIDDKVILYGGSNFPDGVPPQGMRVTHKDMYIYDTNFNLISKKMGNIAPDRGICLKENNIIYFISGAGNTKIYKYYFKNNELQEEEIYDLGFEVVGGYGCIYKGKIYFGKENLYEFDLETLSLNKKSDFIGIPREQSVYFESNGYIYVLSGASNICHLDSYKYDILNDKWEQLEDLNMNLTGSSFLKISNEKVLITGGCNKEIFDEAVKRLSDIEFKKEYFNKSREEVKFNKDIYVYDIVNEKLELLSKGNIENATCGSTLLKILDNMYLINGEYKPGFRTRNVLKASLNLK